MVLIMSADTVKSWNRPWSVQEIIDNASNWSLAGDAGLLKYLETFSENLLSKAEETNDNLNKLLEDLNSASLSLDIVKNDFCSLHNTQFIESRVYEDDETLPVEELQENQEDKTFNEEERLRDMKEAVLRGIGVVDKYFDKVEIPASDTEDETDFPSFVLRPKDPYIDRPLPYVIGTEDWYKKWHVGLLDSSSDSDLDKVSEKFSDSDSEDDLPVQNRTQVKGISNSGSEADLSNRIKINQPAANSTFDESVKQPDIFGSSDSEDYNSVPIQAPISTRSFAQELAAKLGNVVDQNVQAVEPEVNRRPIYSGTTSKVIGNMFSDEPPPIDEEDDELFGNNNVHQGLFSGGGGLFDDLDKGLWTEKQVLDKHITTEPKSKLQNLFEDEDDNIFASTVAPVKNSDKEQNISQSSVLKKSSGGLFDDEDSEDDLFSENSWAKRSYKPFIQPSSKTTMPFFDNEPPELEPKVVPGADVKTKKPVGGVKIFGGTDLFKQHKPDDLLRHRNQDSDYAHTENVNPYQQTKTGTQSNDLFEDIHGGSAKGHEVIQKDHTKENDVPKETTLSKALEVDVEKKSKPLSLFDDDNDVLFEDDLFSNISSKKFTSSLFGEESLKDDLFVTSNAKNENKSGNFPSDDAHKSSQITKTAYTDSLFPTEQLSKVSEPLIETKKDRAKLKTEALFDTESDCGTDDLFSSKAAQNSNTVVQAAKGVNNSDFRANNVVQNISKNAQDSLRNAQPPVSINFFDQNPPDLDDDWDTKSDNLFEDNDPVSFDNTPEISGQRSGLFDNEPPSLFSESSGIVRDASARVETDDSFNPYASSSRRFSSDIFNEQQSSDSFFVTKNKSQFEPQNVQSNLGSIPEILYAQIEKNSQSCVDITPSGNVDDLFGESTVSLSNATAAEHGVASAQQFQKVSAASKNTKNMNIADDNNVEDDDDDLFSSKSNVLNTSKSSNTLAEIVTTTNVEHGQLERRDLLKDSSDTEIFGPSGVKESGNKVAEKPETSVVKPAVLSKPGNASSKSENLEHKETEAKVPDSMSVKIGSPGKLKLNLNINVNALMPGVSPPKRKDLKKSHSLEVASPSDDSGSEVHTVSVSSLASQSNEGLTEPREPQKPIERSVSFENSSDASEILHSITKDRVRIPIKRRPSTRKGRHESIRNSAADFKLSLPVEEEANKEEAKTQVEEPVRLPANTEVKTMENQRAMKEQKRDGSIKQATFEDLFADDESDLFSSKTVNVIEKEISKVSFTSTEEPPLKAKHVSLFGSSESEPASLAGKLDKGADVETTQSVSDVSTKAADTVVEREPAPSIFGEERRSVINSNSFESTDFKKADLFDDSEDFDDIFSTKKLPPKSSILKKSLFDDELDDDDIFGPTSSIDKTAEAKDSGAIKMPDKKPLKTTQIRKLENSKVEEDPLSSFKDN